MTSPKFPRPNLWGTLERANECCPSCGSLHFEQTCAGGISISPTYDTKNRRKCEACKTTWYLDDSGDYRNVVKP